jgi:hypothetical protein
VKEGVGAGGLAVLWQLSGRRPADLALACDDACHQLLAGFPLPKGDGAAGAGTDAACAMKPSAGGAAGGLEAAGQAAHGAPVGAGPAAGWEAWVDAPHAEGELAQGAAASYGRGGG